MFGFINKVNLTINYVDKTKRSLLFRVLGPSTRFLPFS